MSNPRVSLLQLHWLLFRPTFLTSTFGGAAVFAMIYRLLEEEINSMRGTGIGVVAVVLAITTIFQLTYNHARFMTPLMDFFETEPPSNGWSAEQVGPVRDVLVQFPYQIARIGIVFWILAGAILAVIFHFLSDIRLSTSGSWIVFTTVLMSGAVVAPFHYGLLKRSMQNVRYLVSSRATLLDDHEEALVLRTRTKMGLAVFLLVVGCLIASAALALGIGKHMVRQEFVSNSRNELALLAVRIESEAAGSASEAQLALEHWLAQRPVKSGGLTFLFDDDLDEPVSREWKTEVEQAISFKSSDVLNFLKTQKLELLQNGVAITPGFILIDSGERIGSLRLLRLSPRFTGAVFIALAPRMAILAVIAFALVWLLARILNNDITQPQQYMARVVHELAEGDLNQEVSLISDDEMGQFAHQMSRMIHSLRGIVQRIHATHQQVDEVARDIQETSGVLVEASRQQNRTLGHLDTLVRQSGGQTHQIASSANAMRETAEDNLEMIGRLNISQDQMTRSATDLVGVLEETEKAVARIAGAIERVVGGIEDMSGSIQESSTSASQMNANLGQVRVSVKETALLSGRVERDATSGMTSVSSVGQGMRSIAGKVEGARGAVEALGSKAEEIGAITSLINQIAEQTNLLALNASITASQAGAHGRSFSVIASEIRNLSVNTKTSSANIRAIIEDVQEEIARAVGHIQQAAREVENGLRLSGESEKALNLIVQSARRSSQMTAQIDRATEEQASGLQAMLSRIETSVVRAIESREAGDGIRKQSQALRQHCESMNTISTQTRAALRAQSQDAMKMTEAVHKIGEQVRKIDGLLKGLVRDNDRISEELGSLVKIAGEVEQQAGSLKSGFDNLSGSSASLKGAVSGFRV